MTTDTLAWIGECLYSQGIRFDGNYRGAVERDCRAKGWRGWYKGLGDNLTWPQCPLFDTKEEAMAWVVACVRMR